MCLTLQFDRERIPERVVHARGASAKGFFEVRFCLVPRLGARAALLWKFWPLSLEVPPYNMCALLKLCGAECCVVGAEWLADFVGQWAQLLLEFCHKGLEGIWGAHKLAGPVHSLGFDHLKAMWWWCRFSSCTATASYAWLPLLCLFLHFGSCTPCRSR